jgi:16S rRNA G966 N2-methylase RsmD
MVTKIIEANLMSVDARQIGTPDMAYVDPPWGQSRLTYYSHKAHVNAPNWMDFLNALIILLKRTKGHVYIEMGLNWVLDVKQAIMQHGGRLLNEWNITYFRSRGAKLLLASWNPADVSVDFDFTGMDDEETPYQAIKASSKQGETVFDPCIGAHALTVEAAIRQGRHFVGIEVNHEKVKKWENK